MPGTAAAVAGLACAALAYWVLIGTAGVPQEAAHTGPAVTPAAPPVAAPPSLRATAGGGNPDRADASRAAVPPAADAPPGTAPAGLTPTQLAELRASVAGHPDPDAEVARVLAYLAFAQQWQAFSERRGAGAPVAELRPAARTLDAALDARVHQRELSAAEALQVKAALLDVLLPDGPSRQAALARWREALAATQPAAAPDPQAAQFERRQAEIVAAWHSMPAAQRDEQRLEAELQALRESMFPAPAGKPGPTAPVPPQTPGGTR